MYTYISTFILYVSVTLLTTYTRYIHSISVIPRHAASCLHLCIGILQLLHLPGHPWGSLLEYTTEYTGNPGSASQLMRYLRKYMLDFPISSSCRI